MGKDSNLEILDLGGKNSLSYPSLNIASKSGSQIDYVSSRSHCEQNSFEFQIQEIDMELNKFDRVVEVNSEAKVQKFDSYSKTIPKEVDRGKFVGELNLDNLRPLDVPAPDFTPSTSPPKQPKSKEVEAKAHVGDSSVQCTNTRKRTRYECGWDQSTEPCKKIQLSEETYSLNSMVEAARQPRQDQ